MRHRLLLKSHFRPTQKGALQTAQTKKDEWSDPKGMPTRLFALFFQFKKCQNRDVITEPPSHFCYHQHIKFREDTYVCYESKAPGHC